MDGEVALFVDMVEILPPPPAADDHHPEPIENLNDTRSIFSGVERQLPAPRIRRYTDAQIEEALRAEGGLLTAAARRLEDTYGLPCSAAYLRRSLDRSPKLKEARVDIVGEILDMAEGNLLNALNEKKEWATKFTLETLGKDRGFSRRQEHTGAGGGSIEIKIVGDDARL